MDIWSILRPFDIGYIHLVPTFCGNFCIFSSFWYIVPRKIWQPCTKDAAHQRNLFYVSRQPSKEAFSSQMSSASGADDCDTQGCQMVCFQTKNPNLGKSWRALDWKMSIYFIAIWNILWRFGIFYDHLVCTFCIHLVHFFRFCYHVPRRIWQPW
jgi:hypothetical protein